MPLYVSRRIVRTFQRHAFRLTGRRYYRVLHRSPYRSFLFSLRRNFHTRRALNKSSIAGMTRKEIMFGGGNGAKPNQIVQNAGIYSSWRRRFGDNGGGAAASENGGGGGGGGGGMKLLLLAGLIGGGLYYYQKTQEANKKCDFIKSKHSLVYKYCTQGMYDKLKDHKTKTSGTTLDDCIACAVEFDDQHCGIYAADEDCYLDFAELFDPIINEYHNLDSIRKTREKGAPLHQSNMNAKDIQGNIGNDVPVLSTRIRVGRNISGYGLSPGITRSQRLAVESLMKEIFAGLTGDLAGTYYPLKGMKESTRRQLVNDHFLFKSGDRNLQVGGMERDWPEGRGIFHNKDKTFLVWVNEEDQLRIISMAKGGDVVDVFDRLARGIDAIEKGLAAKGKKFQFDNEHGYYHSCPTNLGTGMRASVHIPLKGWQKDGGLKNRCTELGLQPRGIHGESTKDDSGVYDISNKYRLGYTEVQLVQMMVDGVNTLYAEEKGKA